MSFKLLSVRERASDKPHGVVQLSSGDWDDYSFKTSFSVTVIDQQGKKIDLGSVKIGYAGQLTGWTREKLSATFDSLPEGFFSLGQDVSYYKTAYSELSGDFRAQLFRALRDVVADNSILAAAEHQSVFKTSLMRSVSPSAIAGQFRRVLRGEAELTDFDFSYFQDGDEKHAAVKLAFKVKAESKPPTNVHVLIGRNGVGKTTLLNNMVTSALGLAAPSRPPCGFQTPDFLLGKSPLKPDYFSSIVSVSFSAFDPFVPPPDRIEDRTRGPAYFYVGMKNRSGAAAPTARLPPKTETDLIADFCASFKSCRAQPAKLARWHEAIRRLESDLNFRDMNLGRLVEIDNDVEAVAMAQQLAENMSSGHSIVLLTMTKLVDTVEEKTLVLLDEPESHLHPPLLSAFTRALSDLLFSRNGVAIVATHSPVVLQEVPRSCVWKLTRIRAEGRADRPERETFGENVGILTRETFGLEVSKSGFHELMQSAVQAGGTFASICADYGDHLGAEAKAILLSLLAERDARQAASN
jgi:predicted ATPase